MIGEHSYSLARSLTISSEDTLPLLEHKGCPPPLKFVSSVTISVVIRELQSASQFPARANLRPFPVKRFFRWFGTFYECANGNPTKRFFQGGES